jgi:HIRAN domain
MGLFSRKNREASPPPTPGMQRAEAVIFDEADCSELVGVVGESHYQGDIRDICGSHKWEDVSFDCIAALVPEPSNPYDPNAVMVQIDARLVGHLSRADAVKYRPLIDQALAKDKLVACRARIAGHGPGGETSNLGVFLHMPRPNEPIESSADGEATETGVHRAHGDGNGPSGPGSVRGKHFTRYVEQIKQLKREGNYEEAEELLLECVDATEREAAADDLGVAPWYYEQLAIIYRRRHESDKEVAILERFAGQWQALGVKPPQLLDRLAKTRAKLEGKPPRWEPVRLAPRVAAAQRGDAAPFRA